MQLPPELREAISEETARIDRRDLAVAAEGLIEQYKRGNFTIALNTPADRAAYLAVRMPATFAAARRVFNAIGDRIPDCQIQSLLDLGAGPGTVMWAASQDTTFGNITCLERNHALADLGQRLASHSSVSAIASARWHPGDIRQVRDLPAHDLVIVSYVLGELSATHVEQIIRAAWLKTNKLLVLIEPGTPEGFRRIHGARTLLLESGAHLVAPCPHLEICPMFNTGDWCHFAARLERTAEHRRLKSGALGYEDEKFSYIVASKESVPLPDSRVLRHPLIHPGHLRLTLCRPKVPESKTVTKSHKALWRYTRKLEWGDQWHPPADALSQ